MSVTDYLFTSESVTEGHPDKMADQISDAVLDAVLKQDPKGRVACETLLKTGYVMLAGEPHNVLVLLGLGVTELSMNGPSIPLVKRVVRAARAEDARALVGRMLSLTQADDIEREVKEEMVRRFGALMEHDAPVGPVSG